MDDAQPTHGCGILSYDGPCMNGVDPDAPVNLCTRHLMVAHDWMTSRVGATDLLPFPCVACGSRLGVHYPSGWLCAICEWRVGEVPDDATQPIRVDVVYYLRLGDRIKIGTSANPRQRFSALLYDEVLAFERGDRLLEQRRHTQFAAHRLASSEWFSASDELLVHIDVVGGGTDPWSTLARWRSEQAALHG